MSFFGPASAARHTVDVLDIILLAVAADDVPLLVGVPEQLVARDEARVASTARRLVPTVDLSPPSNLLVDHVLFRVFVLGDDVVDVRSELPAGLLLLLDPRDLQRSATLGPFVQSLSLHAWGPSPK